MPLSPAIMLVLLSGLDTNPADGLHASLSRNVAARRRLLLWNGNARHYRNKEFEDAIDYYTMALHYCPEDEEHKKDRAVYLANRAQGHLQLEEVSTM